MKHGRRCRLGKRPNIECNWLAETELIGSDYESARAAACHHLDTTDLSCISVVGRSGTGKSRLLNEIAFEGRRLGKRVVHFDSDGKTANCMSFLREIVSGIEGLPLFSPKEGEPPRWMNCEQESDRRRFAATVLYGAAFRPGRNADRIAGYLRSALSEDDVLLAVDNVQGLDETTIEILDKLLDAVGQDRSSSALVLGINTDFVLPGTSMHAMARRLKALSEKQPASFFRSELVGFRPQEALLYVRKCLNLGDGDAQYDESIGKIVGTHGTQPLFLQQFLLGLSQERIIERMPHGYFCVNDVEGFQRELARPPQGLADVLERRTALFEGHVRESAGEEDDAGDNAVAELRALLSLLGFMKMVPWAVLCKVFPSGRFLDELESAGFVKRSEDGTGLLLYHEAYENLYRDRFPLAMMLNEDALRALVGAFERCGLRDRYLTTYFYAKYLMGEVGPGLYGEMIDRVCGGDLEGGQELVCFDAMANLLPRMGLGEEDTVRLFEGIVGTLEARRGIVACNDYNERLRVLFLSSPGAFPNTFARVTRIIEDGLVQLINQKRCDESLRHNLRLSEFARESCKGVDGQSYFLMQLYNRQSMVYNAKGLFEESKAANAESLRIARALGNERSVISALRGKGDIFYTMPDARAHRGETADLWLEAYGEFVECYGEDPDAMRDDQLKVATYSKALIASLIKGDYDLARHVYGHVRACLGKTRMTYYEIHLRLSSSLLLLSDFYDGCEEAGDDLRGLVNRAADLSVVYGRWQDMLFCHHFSALELYRRCEYERASDAFLACAEAIIRNAGEGFECLRWKSYLVDAAVMLRRCGSGLPGQLAALIGNRAVADEVGQVARASRQEIESWWDEHPDDGLPLTSPDGSVNFPQCN